MEQWHNDLTQVLTLDGTWTLTLGEKTGTVQVPGCWEAQGFPRRMDGPAVYRKAVVVPGEWAGRRVQLQFDAVSYHVEVRVNGVPVGEHTGCWAPFALDVTEALRPGAENEIVCTVWKPGGRFGLRESVAGFLPDVMVMFGGLWQSVRLAAHDQPALSALTVRSVAEMGTVHLTAEAHGAADCDAVVTITAPGGQEVACWRGALSENRLDTTLVVPYPVLWSPEQPALYRAAIRLERAGQIVTGVSRSFGFRTLSRFGEQVLLNGTPVCLRGALNWGWYPDLICPTPDEATIRDEFRRIRALGFNMMKLCLYVPWPRYFEIADEEGMLLWLELPLWLHEITPHLLAQAPRQYAEILAAVHHHPSIVIYSVGCELERHVPPEWVAQLDGIVRAGTSGVLVCDNSGSGEAYGCLSDLTDFDDYHFYCDPHFLQALADHFHRDWRPVRPLIFGEFCAADDYRPLGELLRAHGGELPWWLQEQNPIHPLAKIAHTQQRERMAALGLNRSEDELATIARRQAFAVRKVVLERVRSWARLGGYNVTGLRDTPLATSALFDDFGRSKFDAEAFRQFNDETVLLLGRRHARRWSIDGDRPAPADPFCFVADSPLALEIVLAHSGRALPGGTLTWQLSDEAGRLLARGESWVSGPLVAGRPVPVGQVSCRAPALTEPRALRLTVSLQAGERTVRNSWPVWVFPAVREWPAGLALYDPCGVLHGLDDLRDAAVRLADAPAPDTGVVIAATLNQALLDYLQDGGAVLLLQSGDAPLPAVSGPFWWHAVHLLEDHPVMNRFPHQGFADMQFYGIATPWALDTGRLAEVLPGADDVRPLMRRLHPSQYTLADTLFQARVGHGRLIATTLRFQGGLGDQPSGLRDQVAGRWLLRALLDWLMR